MFKKIILFLFLIFTILNFNYVDATLKDNMNTAKNAYEANKNADTLKTYNNAKTAYENSPEAAGDITAPGFNIKVNDISPGMGVSGGTTSENVNYFLGTIIQNLMIALGSVALLIMTIGAGYMLLHHGEDSMLTKGKDMFMAGVYALVIALSSYYLVAIVRFLLYNGN